ncbi:MAG: protein kinase [Gemmatimonadales bacterium]
MPDSLTRVQAALTDRYHVEREVGAGGMATVYLAQDLRHERQVAVKVLRPELAAVIGAERFLAEIKTTAHLQHPHILPLFDSGGADSFLFYVMPFVAGETLRRRLTREKQLPVAEAVRISTEVASALDYAHRHGVVHRDIKPENILLHDGRALVADFGIALAASKAGGSRMTETGMSLGTPCYMSPEQAMGEREITARSDIYALGCVLYEMLTGDPPFTGSTAQAIVARVLTETPRPILPQRHTIPPHVEAAVLTALEKLPADRFGTAAEFAEALAGRNYAPSAGRTAAAVLAGRPAARRLVRLGPLMAVAASALAVGSAAGWVAARHAPSGSLPARVSLAIPADHRVSPGFEPVSALSPDGTTLVYAGEGAGGSVRLYARRLDELTPVPLTGTEGGCCPVFSPDGEWILFSGARGAEFRKISSDGGAATVIPMASGTAVAALRWAGPDEFVATLNDGSLARVRNDGRMERVARPDSAAREAMLNVMQVLPGGAILTIAATQSLEGPLVAIDPASGARTVILSSPVQWAGYAQDHLVWALSGGALYAAPFDARHARITGAVQALGATAQTTRGGRPKVALSTGGDALAYVPAQPLTLARVGRDGRAATMLGEPRSYHSPRVSPDGRRVLFDFAQSTRDVWLLDLGDTTLTRVTFENDGHDPTWLPNGREFLFGSARGNQIGVFRRNADGSGAADSVLVDGNQLTVHAVTSDGRTGIAAKVSPGPSILGAFDLVTVPLTSEGQSEPLLSTGYNEYYPALSPNSRWLAYVSDESTRPEVYVRPFPGQGGKVLVSQNGGSEPVWSRDGRELFYRSLGPREPQLVTAAVETHPAFRVLSRTPLFDVDEYETAVPHANYDVMPDGRSLVMVRMGRLSEFVYLQHWTELLSRRSGGGNR